MALSFQQLREREPRNNPVRAVGANVVGISVNNNYLSEDGARELCDRIEQYWKERQRTVKFRLEPLTGTSKTEFQIRSDMINGAPRR